MSVGKVWLVGAGPGDPGLVTLRGAALLAEADVVLYDALAHRALLELCRSDALLVDVGKRAGERSPPQELISDQMIEHARAGKRVVRLKGGDPFMFARGSEEAEALARAAIAFEVVPGVTSPVGAAAYAGISLTHRDLSSSVTFITGSDRAGVEWSPEAWEKLATATDTICVLMGMRRIDAITRAIIAGGRAPTTPACVIQWGARPAQRVLVADLASIAEKSQAAGLRNPAVIVIGEVVSLRDTIRWFDTRPLFSKRILVPRPLAQARDTARAIRERGAEPVVMPLIEIVDPPDPAPLARAIADLSSYDWILFTSANGVERFFAALAASHRDARALGSASVGVIGPKTAKALEERGIRADVIAEEHVGEGLAGALLARGPARKVLLARALEAREALPDLLREAGAHVDVVPVYETRRASEAERAELVRLLEERSIDVALFTSSSTASSLAQLLGDRARELLAPVTLASIGPVTSRTLTDLGLPPALEASVYTVSGLLDALERHFAERAS